MLPDRQKPEHLSEHLNSNVKLNSKPDLFSSTFLFEHSFLAHSGILYLYHFTKKAQKAPKLKIGQNCTQKR